MIRYNEAGCRQPKAGEPDGVTRVRLTNDSRWVSEKSSPRGTVFICRSEAGEACYWIVAAIHVWQKAADRGRCGDTMRTKASPRVCKKRRQGNRMSQCGCHNNGWNDITTEFVLI